MSKFVFYLKVKPFIKQWLTHHYGNPVTFPSRSAENACIRRFVGKRVRDAAFFLIIMLVTFAATLLNPQKYVSSRTIQKCVEHVSTST